jgi:PAS domain S-box-containing protein
MAADFTRQSGPEDLSVPTAPVLQHIPTAVICADTDGRIVFVNRRCEALFGYGRDQLRHVDDWWRLAYPDEAYCATIKTVWLAAVRSLISGRVTEAAPIEGQVTCRDGTLRTVQAHLSMIQGPEGGLYIVSLIDVTYLREALNALAIAKQAAEKNARVKDAFLASMSHELRTPLNSIIGFSEALAGELLGPLGSSEYKTYADYIHASGLHLNALIADILDVSRLKAQTASLDRDEVWLTPVIQDAIAIVTPRVKTAEIALAVDLAPELHPIWGDRRRIRQILLNVLGNAIKFTKPGGDVALRTFPREHELIVEIADTGIGMGEEDIPGALEFFRRFDNADGQFIEGVGVGLPLAKLLMDLQGGTLDIQSKKNIGTTVTLRFTQFVTMPAKD